MLLQKINRTDAEKVYIIVQNISGAALSAGKAVYFDSSDTSAGANGIAVSGAMTNKKYLFAGITKNAINDDAYGLVQVYGTCSAYVKCSASSVSIAAGAQLDAVTSSTYLQPYSAIAGSSSTIDNPWNFVTLVEAVASAADCSIQTLRHVFVRAL